MYSRRVTDFQLNDDFVFDQEIEEVPADIFVSVTKRYRHLSFESDLLLNQLLFQSPLIIFFLVSSSELIIDRESRTDYAITQLRFDYFV